MDNADNVGSAITLSKTRVLKPNHNTYAAIWNRKVLQGLEDAYKKNPEVDFATLLPPSYTEQLQSTKRPSLPSTPDHDIRSRLDVSDQTTTIFKLSTEVESLLGVIYENEDLSEAIVNILNESEVLFKSPWAASVMVFRLSEHIVVKIDGNETRIKNEHQSLSYLQEHLPSFPAPRPHGVVRFGISTLLFTTFVPGLNLEKAWPQLDDAQKRSISAQLDALLCQLRSLPFPDNVPLGGISGDGCFDARKGTRVSSEPIMNVEQFYDFIFAGSKTASSVYTRFLRDLMPASSAKCVFTHGDIRAANIMAEKSEEGTWSIAAVIDWESSGFYPEYWECVKMTNNLSIIEKSDWYLYLPESISHRQYPVHWAVDRVWDRCMDNT